MALDITTDPAAESAPLVAGAAPPAGTAQGLLARAASASESRYTSDRRLHLTADGDVVEDDDDRAAFLLVGEGGTIPQALADDLKLKPARKKGKAQAADAPAEVRPEDVKSEDVKSEGAPAPPSEPKPDGAPAE